MQRWLVFGTSNFGKTIKQKLFMWILKYQYDLEDGSIHHVSCCLRRRETYSIGRSSKNPLNVKNDKSISRQHVSVCWDGDQHQLQLINQGKVTAACGKYLEMKESMTFDTSQGAINIELGTKPLRMELKWINALWDIPANCSEFVLSLNELGVEVSLGVANAATTLMVFDGILEHGGCRALYGLIKDISLMNSKLLAEFCGNDAGHETDFEAVWSRIMGDKDLWALPDLSSNKRAPVFQELEFILISSNNANEDIYLRMAIEAGGGNISTAQSLQSLQEIIESWPSISNVVILETSSTRKYLDTLGHKTHTIKDLIDAVLQNDVLPLKNGVSRAKESLKRSSEPVPPSVGKPTAKRRRLKRSNVKPLDILSFFAGGDSLKEPSVESTLKLSSQDQSKKCTDRLEPGSNVSTHREEGPATAGQPVPIESPSRESQKASPDERVPSSEPKIQTEVESPTPATRSSPRSDKKVSAQATRQPTLGNYKSICPDRETSKDDMIQIIQDTKNREVKRLNSTIIQVGEEELTNEAISKLNNLALVDQCHSLMRHRETGTSGDSNESHPEWNHRSNYKKFVKIWPRYRREQDQPAREGSSDSIRNRAFLLTRQYVPMRTYMPEFQRQLHQDMYDFPEPDAETRESQERELENEEQFSFSRASGNSNGNNLFVLDETDSQNGVAAEELTRRSSPVVNPAPAATHPLQDDDSDDELTFKFKRKKG